MVDLSAHFPILAAHLGDARFALLLLFVDWSRLLRLVENGSTLDVVYDEHCHVCARSLYVFESLDVADSVTLSSQNTAPEAYRERSDVDFETATYAFRDGERYEGCDAFGELLRHVRVFYPVALLTALPVVREVGERVCEYVAANRGCHFACSADADAGE